jgi:hypothetical protein
MAKSEIRIAYFILCHKAPEQVIRLIERLQESNSFFIVHIDSRAAAQVRRTLEEYSARATNVVFSERHRCYWGRIGIVRATVACIRKAIQLGLPFDYAFLLSGEDYPIKSTDHVKRFLSKNSGKEFIESFAFDKPNRWSRHGGSYNPLNRVLFWTLFFRSKHIQIKWQRRFPLGFKPHLGSQWWCLSKECIEYLNTFIARNPKYVRYFNWVFIPDECFFQSILSNSPYARKIAGDGIRYADWENPNPNYPRTLMISDLEKLRESPALFARKFDAVRSQELVDRLDDEIGSTRRSTVVLGGKSMSQVD